MSFRIVKLFVHEINYVRYLPDELSLNFNHQFVKRETKWTEFIPKKEKERNHNRWQHPFPKFSLITHVADLGKLTYTKWIASPGSMHDTGCLGLVDWDDPEGWYGQGGGFRMGNTCIPVVDSCWCMAKPIQYCKVINLLFILKKDRKERRSIVNKFYPFDIQKY